MYSTIIGARELSSNLDDPSWVIVDCRYDLSDTGAGLRAYRASHIPGAVYADLQNDLSGPPTTDHGRHPLPTPERMRNLFSNLGISREHQVVVYDAASGAIAARLWWMLRYLGHDQVAVLDGGWQAWLDAGLETVPGEVRNSGEYFSGTPLQNRLVQIEDVLSCALLVDARDPARYRGEQEPIDPVAGHIPGAINHFWRNNLDERGMFHAPIHLQQKYLSLYAGIPPHEIVFYCGSGVTACHNVLAAVHAGLPWPRLYVGSWSEWCTEPGRPIAEGNG